MKKIALITGASSGIGKQIAIDLSLQGFECVLLGRNTERLKDVHLSCKNSSFYSFDMSDEKSIINFSENYLKKNLDLEKSHFVLINNVGIVERSSFESTDHKSWIRQFETNLFGPVLLTKSLLPLLKKQTFAKIINISSTLALKPISNTSAYSASKAAMNNWTQCLALELAPLKINVNAICPGIIETPLQDFYKTDNSDFRNKLNSLQPLGRLGQPSDISNLVEYLASEKSNWMTGSILTLDGGIQLG